MREFMRAFVALLTLAAILSAMRPAQAQDSVAQFYQGRQIQLYIGSTPGGGYDSYGRLLARHLPDYIPGHPTIVPVNMAGAGSNRLAGYLYTVAPKDGSEFGIIFPGAVLDPLIGTQQVQDDPSKFNYIGSANVEVFLCILRADAPVETYEDVLKTPVTLAASADGGSTADMPALENNLLGAQWKVVKGYPGSREINLAIEQGEVQGTCGVGWSSVEVQNPDWITNGKYRIIAQETNQGQKALDDMNVPTVYSYAKNEETREIMQLVYSQEVFGRPFILPPGVPADRVAALRKAFMEAMQDPQLLAEAKTQRLDISPISGEEVQTLVSKVYAMPKDIIAKAKDALVYRRK